MNREQLITTLRSHETELRRRGVRHAALFGSQARGDATPASDVDVLIDLDPDAAISIFDYARLKRYISDLFPDRVDVINRAALKPALRDNATADAVRAF